MKIKALLERRRGEWEEISVQVHPDFPDTGMFRDKCLIKPMDIACGLTWGGQFYAKSYRDMMNVVKNNHSVIENIKQHPVRKDWLTQREQTVIDVAKERNNQELIDYIDKLSRSDNCCVCCGEIIPEGRQVCPKCEKTLTDGPLILKPVDTLRKEKK